MSKLSSSNGPLHGASSQRDASWLTLASLPDPVGFGGMFAGAIGKKLIVGGGSQFAVKPVWLGGQKSYSDQIFVLGDPEGGWVRSETRLPFAVAHSAVAAADHTVYLAGGVTAGGASSACLGITSDGSGIQVARLPDLPVPLAFAAASVVGRLLVVSGGQTNVAEKAASPSTWALSLDNLDQGWRLAGVFPGRPVFVPAAATDGERFYLFGGMSVGMGGVFAPSKEAHRLDLSANEWERLPDLPEPRVAPASPCPSLAGGGLFVIGGYAEIFPGPPREHPGFSPQTLIYDVRGGGWSNGPRLPVSAVVDRDSSTDPHPAPMAAAPAAMWQGLAVVVGGETRASVRTPAVVALPLN